jgi:hypothetical protein
MPTTVHLPPSLLERIDARAKALGISRNRFILEALAEKVRVPAQWPEDFVHALRRPVAKQVAAAADEMQRLIDSGRRSRTRPPRF